MKRVEEIRRLHPDGHRTRLPQGADHTCDVCDLLTALAQAERENERLRAKLAAAEAYGEKERRHFEDWFKRAELAEARTRALVAALWEVWESIPSSHDEADPMVQRHARALNAIPAALTEPTSPQGDECHCGHCRYVRASEPTEGPAPGGGSEEGQR